MMYEIKIVGRGGQGVVTAANVLVFAAVAEGKYACGLPDFGFEREGAPVTAYVRISDKEIRRKTKIYNPDCIILFDENLLSSLGNDRSLKKASTLILNTTKKLDDLKLPSDRIKRIGIVDATGIAIKYLSKPILNSVMLGAFSATTGVVSVENISRRINQLFGYENSKLVIEGYENVKIFDLR